MIMEPVFETPDSPDNVLHKNQQKHTTYDQ